MKQVKKIKIPLLLRVLLAIGLGIGCSFFLPLTVVRIFMTFNDLFGSFLSFVIPLLIVALVAPGIAELGSGAGKLLGITALLAYVFTVLSGYFAYFAGSAVFPFAISPTATHIIPEDTSSSPYTSFFSIAMPPVMDVMSALIIAFILGVGLSRIKGGRFLGILQEMREVITMVINNIIIPLLPFFIFGVFLKISVEGKLVVIMSSFIKIIAIIIGFQIVILLTQYLIGGAVSGRNPFKALKKMMPAYLTALGTQSSAATIPVTLRQVKENGISDDVADFVVPLCATIHLSGSCLTITSWALAISMFMGMPCDIATFTEFIFLVAITVVAAPGVPGGAIMAALGVLSGILGFDEELQGLIIALYITMDSFGTATNVTGDGAVALIIDRIFRNSRQDILE